MVYNFDQYLGKDKVAESLLTTDTDAKKYRLVADFLKSSVGLVSSKGDNLFVVTTPLGDRLVACFSSNDISQIHEGHLNKVFQEALKNLQNNEYSYDAKEEFLVDVMDSVDQSLDLKLGVWQSYYFIPNDNPNLKYKTTFGNSGSVDCRLKIEEGIPKLYKTTAINFKSTEVETSIKNVIHQTITAEDSINYALKKVHVGWELQEANSLEGYKIYLPK